MDLSQYRGEIDCIDDALLELFFRRMEISASIAEYKKQHNLPIYMPEREQQKLLSVAKKAGPEMEAYARELFSCLFTLSKQYQESN